MNARAAKLVLGLAIFILSLACSDSLRAQVANSTLSGTITGSSGAVVPNAKITVKDLATGQSTEAQSDSAGKYRVEALVPGDYEVSVSAPAFPAKTQKVTIAVGAGQILNISLITNAAAPSLSDLGFPSSETQGSAEQQARLDKRSHMLKMHQRLGLITTGPLVATVVLGTFAGGRKESSTDRDLHAGIGGLTVGLYATTAYYAIFAPKIAGTPTRGPIKWHKRLAWIHGTGMVLTPILGAMAYEQKSRGEKIHGIASAHSVVGIVTASAYGAAILAVSVKF